jgi:HTH-type transcriptional regulator/antitoxin MqsA
MKASDRMLNRVKACSEGLLEPEDIRGIRKKLHLTQEAAGLMIGGGARAFQKYESGD